MSRAEFISFRMFSIRRSKSASLSSLSSGMWMREKWLVTPRGRMSSNSGCTEVLVDGAMTPNFRRQPRESTIGIAPCLAGRQPLQLFHDVLHRHHVGVFLIHVEQVRLVRALGAVPD